jgi:hypothetical protein
MTGSGDEMSASGGPTDGSAEVNATALRLYRLLPAVYRLRDGERGPLLRLIQVIAEQVEAVERDIATLYDDWFIETCQDWVVPYLGDLVGYRSDVDALPTGVARRAVANTVRDRRRKGTLALLEALGADLAGWPVRAVEFYRTLALTQPVHLLGTCEAVPKVWLGRGRTADLRDGDALDRLGGAFDTLARTVDVRAPNSHRTPGRHNIPSVGAFVWRLRAYSATRTQARCLEEQDPHRYTFSILGNDAPLFTRPAAPTPGTEYPRGELDVPMPIRRRAFKQRMSDYYGGEHGLEILLGAGRQPVSIERIDAADLTRWDRYRPRPGRVAVDPELGRVLFAHDLLRETRAGVVVSYHYGFSADIGGGEYDRPISARSGHVLYRVAGLDDLARVLRPWLDEEEGARQPPHAVVEITDSQVYDLPLDIRLRPGHSLQLRAANLRRPVIRLPDWRPGPDALRISGGAGSSLTLDGLLVTGNAVQVDGELASLVIRHCTLVPGWGLEENCEPRRPAKPSIELIDTDARVSVEHSIVGSVQVAHDPVRHDPVRIHVCNSVVDATAGDRAAFCALGGDGVAHATVVLDRVTVLGAVHAHVVELAEDSIVTGKILVARRQHGCLRFCSVVPGSRTPRRFNCQPDLVEAAVDERHPPGHERERARQRERLRVVPAFTSTRYGTPGYCQLATTCADEIVRGAQDSAEMGVFHDLYQPQRESSLHAGLDEFTPAGMDAGIIYAS